MIRLLLQAQASQDVHIRNAWNSRNDILRIVEYKEQLY